MSWQDAIERTVTGLGYELVDTERAPGGLLRVYIDKLAGDQPAGEPAAGEPAAGRPATPGGSAPDGMFITVDDCEKVTRQLQHVLEVEACAYERLEVSSPGLDRPLKKPADYARFIGEPIALTLKMPLNGRKKYQGVLSAGEAPTGQAGGGWRIVFGPAAAQQALDFSLDEVRDARLVPVLDFKGRRFAAPPVAPAAGAAAAEMEVDGDHKR